MLPGFISQIISRLDPGPLEIYRERYSCWNYYILEKVYIILLLNPKKNFFPQTIAITSVQQFLKKKIKKVVYFSLNCDILELTTKEKGR